MSRTCTNCSSQTVEYDQISGSFACTLCGTVTSDNNMTSELTFAENASGSTSIVGQFVPHNGMAGGITSSRDMTLMNAKQKIQQLISTLGHNTGTQPTGPLLDTAHRLYSQALTAGFARGRKSNYVICACLYIACVRGKEPFLLIDLSEATEINVFDLGSAALALSRSLGIVLAPNDPSIYIRRYANALNFQEKTHVITMDALKILQLMQRDWIHTGRRPNGLCAACLLLSARAHGHYLDIDQVAIAVRISSGVVKDRLAELSNTQSASVHLDGLHGVLTDESRTWDNDPPSFQRAVIQRSRTKAWRRLLSENSQLREILLHNSDLNSIHSDEDILLLSEFNLTRIVKQVYFQVRNMSRFIKSKTKHQDLDPTNLVELSKTFAQSSYGLFSANTSPDIHDMTLNYDQFKITLEESKQRIQEEQQRQLQQQQQQQQGEQETTPQLELRPADTTSPSTAPATDPTTTASTPTTTAIVVSPTNTQSDVPYGNPMPRNGPPAVIYPAHTHGNPTTMTASETGASASGNANTSSTALVNENPTMIADGLRSEREIQRVKQALLMISFQKQLTDSLSSTSSSSSSSSGSPMEITLTDDVHSFLDGTVTEVMSDLLRSKTRSLLASTTTSIANKFQDRMSTTPIFPDDVNESGYIGSILNNPLLLSHLYYQHDEDTTQELQEELDHSIAIAVMEIELFQDELRNTDLEDIDDDEIDDLILGPEERSIREAMSDAILERIPAVIKQIKVHTSEMGEGRKRARRIKYQQEELTRVIDWSQLNMEEPFGATPSLMDATDDLEQQQQQQQHTTTALHDMSDFGATTDHDESAITSGTDYGTGARRRRALAVGPRATGRR